MVKCSILITFLVSLGCMSYAQEMPPVPEDEVGIVERLPDTYPANWVILNSSGFPQNGKYMIIDVTADNYRYKGAVGAGYLADFAINQEKSEFYISETYYERGNRGPRHDMITVYDQATLMPKREIKLDEKKRFLVSPMSGKFNLVNGKKWALVANYTPAASVTVVDIETGNILNEIPIPGCNLAYPLGERGFATMCGFGEVISIQLDEEANAISEVQSEPFNDLDNDPHFEKVARINDVIYVPTYKGNVTAIDLSGEVAQVGETWSLVNDDERTDGWRPGGWQVISSDKQGHIYVLMHDQGYNGSHKDDGKEVWVFDTSSKSRIRRIELKDEARSIHVTSEDNPHLLTTAEDNGGMIAVYDAASGEFSHKILTGARVSAMHNAE